MATRSGRFSFPEDSSPIIPVPSYTFDSFVSGNGNEKAYNYAKEAAAKNGAPYNPLFIHGAGGLGKSHLLHAVGNACLEQNKHPNVYFERRVPETLFRLYFSEGPPRRRFYEALQNIDVLLIDNFRGFEREEDEEEDIFARSLEAMATDNKVVVFASGLSPDQLHLQTTSLRSYLETVLSANIQAPDSDTSFKILKRKAEDWGHGNVPDEALQLIASRVNSNVSRLEGALRKYIAAAQINNYSRVENWEELLYAIGVIKRETDKWVHPQEINDAFQKIIDNPKRKRGPKPIRAKRLWQLFREQDNCGVPLEDMVKAFNDESSTANAIAWLNRMLDEMETGLEVQRSSVYYLRRRPPD